MKRILVLVLAVCLILGTAACKSDAPAADPTAAPQNTDPSKDLPTEAPEQPTEAPEQPTEAPAEQPTEAPAVLEAGTYVIASYTVGGVTFEGARLKDLGIERTYLALNDDGTGELNMMGEPTPIGWNADGRIAVGGVPMYSAERLDAETILLTMSDAQLKMAKGKLPAEEPTQAPAEPVDEPVDEPTEAPSAEQPAFPGVPYGDSDGVVEHDTLLAMYKWLDAMQSDFRYALTFDQISEAVGKPGFDKKDNDGNAHSAYWTDGANGYITVTFRNKSDKWACGAIAASGLSSDEWRDADISGFPAYGSSAPAGTHTSVSLTETLDISSATLSVTASVPTGGWYPIKRSGTIRFYSAPDAERADYSNSYILVEGKESEEKINFYLDSFENLQEIESRTIGGIEMKGRTYTYIGMDWIEYYGQLNDSIWISVRMSGVDFSEGTETEAIVNSLAFAA